MSKKESKRRIKRRSKSYRRAMIYVNLFFVCFIIFFFIFGAVHTFTNKKNYRKDGIEYYKLEEYEAAIESFDRALACNQWFSSKMNVDIELYKASCYMELHDYEGAARTYSDIVKKYKSIYFDKEKVDFMIILNQNLQKYSDGDLISTVSVFCEAVEKGYYEMSLYAAICYEAQEDMEQMKQYYDIYSNHFGMNSFLYYKYATYYILKEDYSTALSYVEDGIAGTDQEYIRYLLFEQILCYEKLHMYNDALDLATSYISRYPDDVRGQDMYEFLDTRVNINETPLSDKFTDKQE